MKTIEVKNFLDQKLPLVSHIADKGLTLPLLENVDMMRKHINEVQAIRTPSPEFRQVKQLISNKYSECADREGASGLPKKKVTIAENGVRYEEFVITIPANEKKVNDYIKEIEEANREVVDTQKAKDAKFQNAMVSDCGIQLNRIHQDNLPDITLEQAEILSFMIDFNFRK